MFYILLLFSSSCECGQADTEYSGFNISFAPVIGRNVSACNIFPNDLNLKPATESDNREF